MTSKELDSEIQYRLQERLGILCGAEESTNQQVQIALEEIEKFKKEYLEIGLNNTSRA